MEQSKPAYYAVIPADVRYDDSIPANAKLLYGEISALINKDGFCFASNQYFADLYKTSVKSISRLTSSLEAAGYIRREVIRDKEGQVAMRKIYLSVSVPEIHPVDKIVYTPGQNCPEGMDKNVQDTVTSITGKEKEKKEKKNPDVLDEDSLRSVVVAHIQAIADLVWSRTEKNKLYTLVLELYSPDRTVRKARPMRTKKSIDRTFAKLREYAGDDMALMCDILDEAIANGWQGIQPPNQSPRQSCTSAVPQRSGWD